MKFFLLPAAIMATAAVAQNSACAADYIVEACLGTERSKLASCASTDYDCLCAGHNSLITCFNNCPNDTRVKDAAGQRDIFCGYASQFPSKTTKVNSPSQTAAASQTSANSQNDQTAPTGSESSSPSASSTGSPATNSNSAAYLALNAGGVLAAVAGVVAVVL
ncbi:hypothetical protein QBC42DRAFT_259017 [Cladorrhinum samala]|uniref:GPI anchored serine-threonine rich protein n=1 Tax=Cladorrhinum samala TaxID=585594 RepID=A0AAV9HZZ7_9PEZI|nr:hypothetical protein QBC42DRAFT_259017 [Cladorrhinum samala]